MRLLILSEYPLRSDLAFAIAFNRDPEMYFDDVTARERKAERTWAATGLQMGCSTVGKLYEGVKGLAAAASRSWRRRRN